MVLNNKTLLKYNYRVYGLNIESDILVTELLQVNDEEFDYADVSVYYGVMPEAIKHEKEKGAEYGFKKGMSWFSIKGVAHYYICNGDTIIIEPYRGSNIKNIKTFLLGSALGILLIQRNIVAIHGGTVAVDGKGVIFTGQSGAGKSTLTAAFRDKGFAFLADDISVISKEVDGRYAVNHGYPQQKLCYDALEKMGYNTGKFMMIDSARDKYAIPVHDNFIKGPMPVGALFELKVSEVKKVQISEIRGSEKLKVFVDNIYRIELTRYIGIEPAYFKGCVDIISTIPVYRITRPKGIFSVEQQIRLIIDAIKSIGGQAI